MENIKKKMKEEQNVLKGNTSENFSCIEKVETHEKLDKDGNSGNLWKQKKGVPCARQYGDKTAEITENWEHEQDF